MTDKKQIIIDGVDVSECVHYEDLSCTAFRDSCGYPLDCKDFFFCNYKQLARKTQECERMKYYLTKIRQDELSSLDVEWDEYITECTSTDYSNIITYVEYALGERKDD